MVVLPSPRLEEESAWGELWMATRILVRHCGDTVDLDDPAELAGFITPLTLPIAIITAANQYGIPTDAKANRLANQALRAELDRRALPWLPATGRARRGDWAEHGFAISGLSEHEALALGLDWGQLAIFWVSETNIAVLVSDGSGRWSRQRAGAWVG